MSAIPLLLKKNYEIYDLEKIVSALKWDTETNMPIGGLEGRLQQISTISRLRHELFTNTKIGDLIDKAEEEVVDYPYESFEKSLVRNLKRSYLKTKKLPTEFIVRENELSTKARAVWGEARQENDYSIFLPIMEQLILSNQEKAELYGYQETPYDALLDNFEPETKSSEITSLFAGLKKELLPFLHEVIESKVNVDDSFLYRTYDIKAQEEFAKYIITQIGFDFNRGHLGTTLHPFCTNFNKNDVRITTRWNECYLSASLFPVIHEAGHALYEQGLDDSLKRTILCDASSLGIHESQSRMFENMVGRSYSFWQKHYKALQSYFPKTLSQIDCQSFYKGINKVKPSFIRVEADELSYNLHVMLRFELEQEMLIGKLVTKDLPEAWNHKMQSYLNLKVEKDSNGCLQDIHWSILGFGYFPTYTIGNMCAAQFLEVAKSQNKTISADLENGNTSSLLQWLRLNIHSYGRILTPKELVLKVTKKQLTHEPFMNYVKNKYRNLYGL